VNLLLVNWQDPSNPHAGGAEIHLHEIFRRLRERGHPVVWLASGWRGAPARDELDGMEIHRTASRYTFGAAVPFYYRRKLARRGFDVVVEALNKVPVYSPAWSRSPSVLIVHHLFGTTAFQEAPLPIAALTWLLERPVRRLYRSVPVQAISHSTATDLVGRGVPAPNLRVIHPGVDQSFFRPADSPTRAVIPTFLYLGRLQRYKRVDLILQAFARLHAEGRPCRLIIAGRGDREASLRGLAGKLEIADCVEFAGFVSETRKRELFRAAWANVFVSPKEGWGITNLEAAACGTPTIASDSPGLRESVVSGRTGFLVPHGDVAALALAMRRLAVSPALVEELGATAHDFAADFTWERSARETERHLLEVARHGRALNESQPPSTG
jgi:glycosyltransferase involved in cell wall biosynthesis